MSGRPLGRTNTEPFLRFCTYQQLRKFFSDPSISDFLHMQEFNVFQMNPLTLDLAGIAAMLTKQKVPHPVVLMTLQ